MARIKTKTTPITRTQAEAAYNLARAFGHLWGHAPKEEAIEAVMRGDFDAVAAMVADRRTFRADIDRPEVAPRGFGEFATLRHRTGSGRLGWMIRPDGVVSFAVYRTQARAGKLFNGGKNIARRGGKAREAIYTRRADGRLVVREEPVLRLEIVYRGDGSKLAPEQVKLHTARAQARHWQALAEATAAYWTGARPDPNSATLQAVTGFGSFCNFVRRLRF